MTDTCMLHHACQLATVPIELAFIYCHCASKPGPALGRSPYTLAASTSRGILSRQLRTRSVALTGCAYLVSGMGPNSRLQGSPSRKPVSTSSSSRSISCTSSSWALGCPLAKVGYLEFCPTPGVLGASPSCCCDLLQAHLSAVCACCVLEARVCACIALARCKGCPHDKAHQPHQHHPHHSPPVLGCEGTLKLPHCKIAADPD